MELIERRVLFSTDTVLGTGSGNDQIRFWCDSDNAPFRLVYSGDRGDETPVSDSVSGSVVTKVTVNGAGGEDAVTLDLSTGSLSTAGFAPSIEFDGGTGANSLTVKNPATGTAGNDS